MHFKNCPIPTLGLLLAVGLLATCVAPASATYYFGNISANNVTDAALGESALSMEVTEYPSVVVGTETINRVLFEFFNGGDGTPEEWSSICDVYFDDGSLDDGSLLALAGLIDSDDGIGGDPEVDFSPSASPGELPAANNIDPVFETTQGFLTDSDPPAQPNGVNPGEFLGVFFTLERTQTYADVVNELESGKLRVGIHVQGFASGGSESFVNVRFPNELPGGDPVPEPGSLLIWLVLAISGGGYGWWRRRTAC